MPSDTESYARLERLRHLEPYPEASRRFSEMAHQTVLSLSSQAPGEAIGRPPFRTTIACIDSRIMSATKWPIITAVNDPVT